MYESLQNKRSVLQDASSQHDSPVPHSHKEQEIVLKWAVKCLSALFISKIVCPIISVSLGS